MLWINHGDLVKIQQGVLEEVVAFGEQSVESVIPMTVSVYGNYWGYFLIKECIKMFSSERT